MGGPRLVRALYSALPNAWASLKSKFCSIQLRSKGCSKGTRFAEGWEVSKKTDTDRQRQTDQIRSDLTAGANVPWRPEDHIAWRSLVALNKPIANRTTNAKRQKVQAQSFTQAWAAMEQRYECGMCLGVPSATNCVRNIPCRSTNIRCQALGWARTRQNPLGSRCV